MVRTQLLGRPRSQVSSPGSEDRSVVAARLHADVQPCRPRESWSYACTGTALRLGRSFTTRPAHPTTYARTAGRAASSVQGTSRWPPYLPRPEKGRSGRGPAASGGRSQQQDPGSIRNGPCPSIQGPGRPSADTVLSRQQCIYRSPSEAVLG